MLEIRDLTVHYGKALALDEVDLTVGAGQLVAVIGPNGAGKTTLLRTVSGLIHPSRGAIHFQSHLINRLPPHRIVRGGLVHCPEGRRPFPELQVRENLVLGSPLWGSPAERHARLEEVFQLFPRLRDRQKQLAGTLSGGEQQMLALGRALMCRPRLLLLDEPSMGLAPKLLAEVFEAIGKIKGMGMTVLLVEQNVETALDVCDAVSVLDHGRMVFHGQREELLQNAKLKEIYLGLA